MGFALGKSVQSFAEMTGFLLFLFFVLVCFAIKIFFNKLDQVIFQGYTFFRASDLDGLMQLTADTNRERFQLIQMLSPPGSFIYCINASCQG